MAQEGRARALNEKAGRLLQALRAPRHSRSRKRLPFLLEEFRREAQCLEQRTRDFALGMPVEFFAEYRTRRRALSGEERSLGRLCAQDTAQTAEPLPRALAAHYDWCNRRAAAYLAPQLDELDDLLAKARR